jgi:hypothetical protein
MNQHIDDTLAPELNLTTHRASGAGVWNRPGWDGSTELAITRWLVGIGGGALAIEGLRRRGSTGSFFAGLGSTLVWWALTGPDNLIRARLWFAEVLERRRHPTDPVQAASDDSFPASDAPAFTPTVGTGVRASPEERRH